MVLNFSVLVFWFLGLVLEFLVALGLQSFSLGFKSISLGFKNSVIVMNSSVLSQSCSVFSVKSSQSLSFVLSLLVLISIHLSWSRGLGSRCSSLSVWF